MRDTGLGGGSLGESWPDGTGDVVRLRKGLFEGRLSVRLDAFVSMSAHSWSVTAAISIVSVGVGDVARRNNKGLEILHSVVAICRMGD